MMAYILHLSGGRVFTPKKIFCKMKKPVEFVFVGIGQNIVGKAPEYPPPFRVHFCL